MAELIIDALATHRLTRLVTADTITRPWRARVIRYAYDRDTRPSGITPELATPSFWDELPHNDDDAPKLAAFIVCPWCTGFWIAIGVALARRYASRLWEPIARTLALSSAAALLAGHEVEA